MGCRAFGGTSPRAGVCRVAVANASAGAMRACTPGYSIQSPFGLHASMRRIQTVVRVAHGDDATARAPQMRNAPDPELHNVERLRDGLL